jgi:hypothetical protein
MLHGLIELNARNALCIIKHSLFFNKVIYLKHTPSKINICATIKTV